MGMWDITVYVEHGNDLSMCMLEYRGTLLPWRQRRRKITTLEGLEYDMREATIACNCVSLFHCYAAANGTIDTACYACSGRNIIPCQINFVPKLSNYHCRNECSNLIHSYEGYIWWWRMWTIHLLQMTDGDSHFVGESNESLSPFGRRLQRALRSMSWIPRP